MKYETRRHQNQTQAEFNQKARQWAQVINYRKDEALAARQSESVVLKAVFLDQTGKGDFLIVESDG